MICNFLPHIPKLLYLKNKRVSFLENCRWKSLSQDTRYQTLTFPTLKTWVIAVHYRNNAEVNAHTLIDKTQQCQSSPFSFYRECSVIEWTFPLARSYVVCSLYLYCLYGIAPDIISYFGSCVFLNTNTLMTLLHSLCYLQWLRDVF